MNKEEVNTPFHENFKSLPLSLKVQAFPTIERKPRVTGYGRVLEWEIEGTEKSIYWMLWPNFEMQCSTTILAQAFSKSLWSAYKLSLAII